MEKLKSCPFCGGEAIIDPDDNLPPMTKDSEERQPYHVKFRDEENKVTVIQLKVPDEFTVRVKDWRYTILMELAMAMANPEDFI